MIWNLVTKKAKKSRKISHQEARETVAILKTMNSICMSKELDDLGCCQYEMRCDLRGFSKQNPTFVKHCKKLAKEQQFTASHEVLQMINFNYSKTITSEKWHKLPDKFTKFIRGGIEAVERRTILSVELVGLSCYDNKPIFKVIVGETDERKRKKLMCTSLLQLKFCLTFYMSIG